MQDNSETGKRKLKIRFGVGTLSETNDEKRPKIEYTLPGSPASNEPASKLQKSESDGEHLSHALSTESQPAVDPTDVTMSKIFKPPSMQLSDCLKIVTSTKGYRTAKATHAVDEGCWYYEAKILHLGPTGHCRIGWATKNAHLYAPVGYDEYGYSYRDLEGTKQHNGKREPYGVSFAEGDVIGCLIYCPKQNEEKQNENPETTTTTTATTKTENEILLESFIGFSKNGEFQDIAFKDITKGAYYPAVSLFTSPEQTEGASIELHFGPVFHFAFPQVPNVEVKGMYEKFSAWLHPHHSFSNYWTSLFH